MYQAAHEADKGIIAFSPLAQGTLTDRYERYPCRQQNRYGWKIS